MTRSVGPAFRFDGEVIPIEIKVQTLEEAERNLQQHLANRPGPLDPRRFDPDLMERRRAWALKKEELDFRLELARAYQGATPESKPVCTRKPGKRSHKRKTAEDFAEMMEDAVAQMGKVKAGGKEWMRLRSLAYSHRFSARHRAEEDGVTCPELPEIPSCTIPEHLLRRDARTKKETVHA